MNSTPYKLLLAAALAAAACGEDEAPETPNATTPRFAISTNVFNADFSNQTTFIGFTDDLSQGMLSLDDAIEVPGGGALWGLPGAGEYYITSAETLTVTKFSFVDGAPTEVGRLGVSGAGVSALFGELMIFDSPTKGYLVATTDAVALELDLDKMEIVRSIDMSAMLIPGAPSFLTPPLVARGNELVGAVYGTNIEQETVSETSNIVFFDTSTGAIEVVPAPCGGLVYTMAANNGDIMFASDPWTAGINAIDSTRAPEPCLARLPAGSRTPDPNVVRLNTVIGGPTGGLIPAGNNGLYVRVLDTSNFPIGMDTTGIQLFGTPGWLTYEIDLANPSSAQQVQRGVIAGGIRYFDVDGVFYETQSAATFTETTLVRTTGADAPAESLVVPGVPFEIVRLR
ncbi:MAG: hypothetical protein AAFU79_24950 [Myxococcota bacterium]